MLIQVIKLTPLHSAVISTASGKTGCPSDDENVDRCSWTKWQLCNAEFQRAPSSSVFDAPSGEKNSPQTLETIYQTMSNCAWTFATIVTKFANFHSNCFPVWSCYESLKTSYNIIFCV